MASIRSAEAAVALEVPRGWDARVSRRPRDPNERSAAGTSDAAVAESGPSLAHVASFPLPQDAGDFGSGAVEAMGSTDAFVSLFEYDAGSAAAGLFEHEGVPADLRPADFTEDSLQRPQAGQVGLQRFFRVGDRAFCLYVVLGHRVAGLRKLPVVNQLLRTMEIDGATTSPERRPG